MTEKEMNKIKEFFKPTGITVKFNKTWNDKGVDTMVLSKDDETLVFYASTENGCEECDSDGRNNTTIEVW